MVAFVNPAALSAYPVGGMWGRLLWPRLLLLLRQERQTSTFLIPFLILCGHCAFTTWSSCKSGPGTTAIGPIPPALAPIGSRGILPGGVTIFGLDISTGSPQIQTCSTAVHRVRRGGDCPNISFRPVGVYWEDFEGAAGYEEVRY